MKGKITCDKVRNRVQSCENVGFKGRVFSGGGVKFLGFSLFIYLFIYWGKIHVGISGRSSVATMFNCSGAILMLNCENSTAIRK